MPLSEESAGKTDQEKAHRGAGVPTPSEEEAATGPAAEELRPLDVCMVLRTAIAQFSGVAWQMLGLHPDPFTNAVRKDIAQARLAIDITASLVEKLQPQLQGQEARDYQTLLTDLRLNFVRQAGAEESP